MNSPDPGPSAPAIQVDVPDGYQLRRVGPGGNSPRTDVVPALAADSHVAGALLTLQHLVSQAGGSVGFTAASTRAEIAPAVAAAMSEIRAGQRYAVVATEGNELVGAVFLVPATSPVRRHLAEVRGLMVHPEHQGSGLGRELLTEIESVARQLGIEALTLGARDGSGLDQFYRSLGYRQIGTMPQAARLPDGSVRDELLFYRSLADQPTAAAARLVELSHPITDGMVTYPGIPAPKLGSHLTFDESMAHYAPGTEFSIGLITMAANTGTYLDTPAHRYRGGADLSGVPLTRVADLPAVVVDCRDLTPAITELPLPDAIAGHAVLLHTGHSRRWGTDEYFHEHPYLTATAVQQLLDAKVALVGIDSLNIDSTHTGERVAHSALLAAGIPVVEHLTGLDLLPAQGFRFTAAPPRINGMATFPVRAFAVLPG